MKPSKIQGCGCETNLPNAAGDSEPLQMLPLFKAPAQEVPCCGPPAGPAAGKDEQPGYAICHFVDGFMATAAGKVPRIKTALERRDHMGTVGARVGFARNDYTVAPGLYALGEPGLDSPVLVTANYKLSFDHLRRHLAGTDAWILVLDTRGINVWCAAGKGTFGTREIVNRVQAVRLNKVVAHRRLILPQLGAPGVSAAMVKRMCGFEVIWGPIRAQDLPAFLKAGQKADGAMRCVTFSLKERMVLVPVEFYLLGKPLMWTLLAIFILSGLGRHFFAISATVQRGLLAAALCAVGIVAGCALVPLLLPWIPGRAFSLKGGLLGLVASASVVIAVSPASHMGFWPAAALVLFATTLSSYTAMNFTGTTPFTSPSGVEKEMRIAIPLQLGILVAAAGIWVAAAF